MNRESRPPKYVNYSFKDINTFELYPSLILQNSACKDHFREFLSDKSFFNSKLNLAYWEKADALQQILIHCPAVPPVDFINLLKHQLVDFAEDFALIDSTNLQQINLLNPPEDSSKMVMILEQIKLKVEKLLQYEQTAFIAALKLGRW